MIHLALLIVAFVIIGIFAVSCLAGLGAIGLWLYDLPTTEPVRPVTPPATDDQKAFAAAFLIVGGIAMVAMFVAAFTL